LEDTQKQGLRSRAWWAAILRESFGPTFWLFAGFALLMAWICYAFLGPEVFGSAVDRDKSLLANTLPRLAAAQVVAGLIWVMLPRDRFSRLLGNNSGHRGLAIATVAGIITPGGPASAYPFLAIMGAAGADRGVMVAYISSWALLATQRMIVWDIPFMGIEFAALRFLVCLPLPILAGLIARRLPISMSLPADASPEVVRR
jgi:uncharacterized membrane protein YraQ (UPF0718 family)